MMGQTQQAVGQNKATGMAGRRRGLLALGGVVLAALGLLGAILPSASSLAGPQEGQPLLKPGQVLQNSLGMKMAYIPAGKFRMGTPKTEEMVPEQERPVHEVEITRPFWLGVYEVTQDQYQKVMEANPSNFAETGAGKDKVMGLITRDFPVEMVSWNEAVEFCRRLSEMPEEKKAGRVYRLPTEAEWEYACRAGSSTAFAFGDSLSSEQANFDGNVPYGGAQRGKSLGRTCAVGSYKPNRWGLHDMHGNVWEWCADFFDPGYYAKSPPQDPPGPTESQWHTIRGGSWSGIGRVARSGSRLRDEPDHRLPTIGFRVALTPAR